MGLIDKIGDFFDGDDEGEQSVSEVEEAVEEAGLVEKLKDDRGFFDSVVSKIPGYKGYKEREIRRDADRLVRQKVASMLEEEHKCLSGLQVELLSAGKIDLLDDFERVGTKMQGAINRIKTASYGYAGLFDAVKVDEAQLDALQRFDAGLLGLVDQIGAEITAVEDAVAMDDDLAGAFKSLRSTVDEFSRTVRGRDDVIVGENLT